MSGRNANSSRSIILPPRILIPQFNELLGSLDLPFLVHSHTQLTPALLISILERFGHDLAISDSQRTRLVSSDSTKVHCIKIFLGVLQDDVLQQDVRLSDVDPRRLALGEEEETLFICRLLCWYGRRNGLISRDNSGRLAGLDALSPSTLTTALTKGTQTPVVESESPNTSVSPVSASSIYRPVSSAGGEAGGPRCIHEVPSPSLVLSPSSAHPGELESSFLSDYPQNTTIRWEGDIRLVDEDAQIAAFEEQRHRSRRLSKRRDPQNESQEYGSIPDNSALLAEQERMRDLIRRLGKRRQDSTQDDELPDDPPSVLYHRALVRHGKRRQGAPHEDKLLPDHTQDARLHGRQQKDDEAEQLLDRSMQDMDARALAALHAGIIERRQDLMQQKADMADALALRRLQQYEVLEPQSAPA
ncbi:hypothetical protein C8R46DRAFT_369020 [Mycena filopes]|nr:hypothetical protein C8R46DRAFT_369020 [Mycena filopes]